MRLISQDGTDIPYEEVAVKFYGEERNLIIAYGINDISEGCVILGKYNTEEKAKAVMQMLKNSYKGKTSYFIFPENEELEAEK